MVRKHVWPVIFTSVFLILTPLICLGQIGGGIGGGLGGGQGGGQGGFGNAGGILIDADGVVSTVDARRKPVTVLRKAKADFIKDNLTLELATPAGQRTVSLNAVFQQISVSQADQVAIPESLLCLGGLTRIDHIIIDREVHDVLISGPAEGFIPDDQGRRIGLETGRPTLWLEDLVTAVRSRQGNRRGIGCSIDPSPENLVKLQNYLQRNSSPTTSAGAAARFREMDDVLGLQEISVWGVPEDSHFARVLVEADYRMKRIAIGAEPAGVRGIRSHLAMLTPQGNTLQRWWFVPVYDAIKVNADRTVFEVSGPRAQLFAQEEISDASGNRTDAPATRKSIELFAQQFSEHLDDLAAVNPVFAEMQNMFDLALLAALLDREGVLDNPDFRFTETIRSESLAGGGYAVPKYVKSMSTFKRASGGLLLGLVGGISLNIDSSASRTETVETQAVTRFRQPSGQASWWWNGQAPAERP